MNGFWFTDEQEAIREGVLRLCAGFDAAYWRRTDETGEFPEAFVAAMAEAGWLGAAMPVELGGSGLASPRPPSPCRRWPRAGRASPAPARCT